MTKQNEQSGQTQLTIQVVPSEVEQHLAVDSEFDFFGFLLHIVQRWKLILIVTSIGVLISVMYALSLERVYQSSIQVSVPTLNATSKMSVNGLTEYTEQTFMQEYYEQVRSVSVLREFVVSQGYLSKLYGDAYVNNNADLLFSALANTFSVQIDEPVADAESLAAGIAITQPTRFTMTLQHSDEAVVAQLLNEYVVWANEALLVKMHSEQSVERASKIKGVENEIILLRSNALAVRQLTAQRMTVENAEKINSLQQQKELLIAKSHNDRLTRIAKLEEANTEALNVLEQKKQLLIGKANDDRLTKIATLEDANLQALAELVQKKELLIAKATANRISKIVNAQEALVIAKSLDIIYPTKLDLINKATRAKIDANTNIILSGDKAVDETQSPEPLFLMGSKYLTTLITNLKTRKQDDAFVDDLNQIESDIQRLTNDQKLKRLKARESEVPFLVELNQINSDIERVKNDQVLKTLKNRKSERPFLLELNQIENEISLITNDVVLKALNERQSDDPFILDLPVKFADIALLKGSSLEFDGVQAYTLDKPAFQSNHIVKPNRRLIVVIGAVLSGFVALMVALIANALRQRTTREQQGLLSQR